MTRLAQRLAGLEYMESELANVIEGATERIADPEVSRLMHEIAMEHDRQAAEIDELVSEMEGAHVPADIIEAAESLTKRVDNSKDQNGIVDALLEAEREDLERHRALLMSDLPDETAEVLQRQADIEAEHVNFFENRAPAMAPDIHGSRTMPGKGHGAF